MVDIKEEEEKSLAGKAFHFVTNPLADTAKGLGRVAEELGDLKDAEKDAYNKNLGPGGSLLKAAGHGLLLKLLQAGEKTTDETAKAVDSIKLDGGDKGSAQFDSKGGLAGLYNTTSRVNTSALPKTDEPLSEEVKMKLERFFKGSEADAPAPGGRPIVGRVL